MKTQREIEIQAGESGRTPGGHKSSKMATSASEKWAAAIEKTPAQIRYDRPSGPLPYKGASFLDQSEETVE